MSYFNAQPGTRPAASHDAPEAPAVEDAPITGGVPGVRPALAADTLDSALTATPPAEASPLFGAALGERPATGNVPQPVAIPAPAAEAACSPAMVCPLCRGALSDDHGILRCTGRCSGRWIEDIPGQLLDLAALPYGVCACCERPRPLVRGARGAVCPVSGSEYLLLPEGPRLLGDAAPLGLCLCCAPAAPLIYRDGALVCQAKPASRYERKGGQVQLIKTAAAAETLAAIDAALRKNAAKLTTNGLFVLDD